MPCGEIIPSFQYSLELLKFQSHSRLSSQTRRGGNAQTLAPVFGTYHPNGEEIDEKFFPLSLFPVPFIPISGSRKVYTRTAWKSNVKRLGEEETAGKVVGLLGGNSGRTPQHMCHKMLSEDDVAN